jgi:hypothetical protein
MNLKFFYSTGPWSLSVKLQNFKTFCFVFDAPILRPIFVDLGDFASNTFHIDLDHRHLIKMDWLMVHTTCLVVNVSFVSGCEKFLAVEAGTSIDKACLPCWPNCLVSLPALAACLPCQPALAACLGSLPWQPSLAAFLGSLPWQPSLAAFLGSLPWQPSLAAFLGSLPWQPSLAACLPVLFCAQF